ncbi:MAG: hypothetical protein EPN82_04285 [Bacteroidetes bacterium]|nr:MAG: hypothetical protein EPN82_04285 [Bacteroidota bacterium]
MKFNPKNIAIILLFFCLSLKAEERSSYEGTHFLIGFMENEIEINGRGLVLQLFITSSYTAEFKVKIPGQTEQKYKINPKQVFHLDLPSNVENRQSEVKMPISVEITSDVPISVYAFNSQFTTSDSYSAIPVNYWGNEYVVISMPNDQYKLQYDPMDLDSSYVIPRSSEFMVIAAYDNTTIEFQPKAITRAGKQTFMKYNETLNKGDCYLVQSYAASRGNADLTGTIVKSDKPIGVLSGHVRTAIPQNDWPSNDKDHICEMLMPTSAWGKEFVSVPFGTNPNGDLFKLTAIYDNTLITYENPYGTHNILLDVPGASASIWDAFEPTVWRSNKPVQIGQFMRHQFGSDPDRSYDPCLVILPPTEQFVNRIIFQTVGNTPSNPSQFDAHYIYIICDQKAIPTLVLDGNYVKDTHPMIQVQNVPGTQYNWERIRLNDGVHEIFCQEGKFSGVLYGTGLADSYGMTLGSSLNNPYGNDTMPPTISINENCGKINGLIKETIDSRNSGISFFYVDKDITFNYQWQFAPYTDTSTTISFTAQPLDPTIPGQFVLVVFDKNNNKSEYSFYYKGIDLEIPDNVDFGIVNVKDTSCKTILIINNSQDTVRIDSISGLTDSRLSITKYFNLPSFMAPGDTILFDLCFIPDTTVNNLSQNLFIAFECDRFKYIPVYGIPDSPNLQAIGYEFGKVRIGDTVCADVYIVNKGNLPVLLQSLIPMSDLQVFRFDTVSIFPVYINSGDTVKIRVCFCPDSLKSYQTIQTALNNRMIPNSLIVTGRGAAPNVKSIIVDWGGRRIQTVNDTTYYLVNNGDYKCNVRFDNVTDTVIAFDTTSLYSVNKDIEPGDSVAIAGSFIPLETISYSSIAEMKVDWKYHEAITVVQKGKGTLPQISTIDVVFDTTKVFSRRDTVAAVIKSSGNEKLTIDSARFFSGDSSSFKFDYTLFRNLVINPLAGDTLFKLPIQFLPKWIGHHEMIVEVIHDAAPGFLREMVYFKISGNAIKLDTLKPFLNAVINGKLYPCMKDTENIIIINEGNVDLILQSISIETDGVEANLLIPGSLQITIPPDSSLKIPYYVIPEKNQSGKIKFSLIFNDSITIEKTINTVPDKNFITIQDCNNLEVDANDTITLELTGNITKPAENPTEFVIELSTKQKNLFLIRKNFDILFFNSNGVSKYNVNVVQDSDKIVIRSKEKILIDQSCTWSVKLDLLVLLGDDLLYNVDAMVMAEPCYEPDTTVFEVIMKEVCLFDLRHVALGELPLYDVRILPDPIADDINLIFTMGNDDWMNFTVFDRLGKKCFETENLFLKKGIHSRIFEFSLFTNGIYFLTIKNSVMTKNIMFIKYCY